MGEIFSQSTQDVNPLGALSDERARQSYALLGVSPFTIENGGKLIWHDIMLAARLLRAPDALLPRREEMLERRLSAECCRLRQSARAGLTWDGARYSIEYQIDTYDGQKLWVEECAQRLSGNGKEAAHITATLTDIDDRKRSDQKIIYRASHDTLSGLWNEARLREGLVFLDAAAKAVDKPYAVLRLRLSNLADINTGYGYEVGDRIVKSIAERLSSLLPAPNMIARIAGSSFAAAILDCGPSDVKPRVSALLKEISETLYEGPHGALKAEFIIGSVTVQPEHEGGIDSVLSQSQQAMRRAVMARKPYLAYSPDWREPPKISRVEDTSRDDIIAALNSRHISLAYQPIVEAKTKALHHYECLLRLKRGDNDIVSAGGFIMAAERLGVVSLLDRRALEIAAHTLARYPDIKLALNVSAATVKDQQSADDYMTALRALGTATPRITLELTETAALGDPAMASRFSVQARALGCEFSIDDFGSGHTSFQNLMAIEADSLKIDGSFVKDLSLTPHKQTFIRMMVDLAQTFSVKTVAEMVETPEDAELLKRLGVDYLQGYLFGRPMAAPAGQMP